MENVNIVKQIRKINVLWVYLLKLHVPQYCTYMAFQNLMPNLRSIISSNHLKKNPSTWLDNVKENSLILVLVSIYLVITMFLQCMPI